MPKGFAGRNWHRVGVARVADTLSEQSVMCKIPARDRSCAPMREVGTQ